LGDPSEQNKGAIVPSLPSVRVVGHDGGNVVELDRVGLGLCGAGAGTGEVAADTGAAAKEEGAVGEAGGANRPGVLTSFGTATPSPIATTTATAAASGANAPDQHRRRVRARGSNSPGRSSSRIVSVTAR
jgi:hypothetical protein